MSERAQQPQIVQMTTEEFVADFTPDVVDRFVVKNGGLLAKAYTGGEAFSDIVDAPLNAGYRASDILVVRQERRLVGFLQPLIFSLLPIILETIPEHLRQPAAQQAVTTTCIGFGPMIVDDAFKDNGIASSLLEYCLGRYFPQTIMQLRQRVPEVITPRDIDLHSKDKKVDENVIERVTRSLDTPLFLVESEHPWLLDKMRRVIRQFPELYVTTDLMTEVEAAVTQVLMDEILSWSLRPEQKDSVHKFGSQLRLPYADKVSVNHRRSTTCTYSDKTLEIVIQSLQQRGLTTTIIESIKEVQFTSPRINLEERDELHAMFEGVTAELGLTVSSADEIVYRSVVGTRF